MGRLFWKFFLSILLAQVAATVGIGGAFWLRDQARHRVEAAELDTGMQAQFLLDAAGLTLKHGGVPALREMVQAMRRHTVYLLDADGAELLGRSVPAELRASAAAQLKQASPRAAVRSLLAPDGQRYLAFVPRFDMRTEAGVGPLVSKAGQQRERAPGGPPDPFGGPMMGGALGGPGPGDAMRGPPGGPMFFGYRVGRIFPLIGATLASLLFAVLLAWYFSRPIRALRSAFDAASKGDLAPRFDQAGGSDEFRDLGRDFDRMTEQLRNLIDGQRRLLHDVSHELRSPLARLQAAIGLAHQQPDKLASSLDRIERESVRMDKLVGELLTLSRLEANQRIEHREPIDIGEMVGQIADDARFESSNSGASIVVAAVDGITVSGDPDLLWRAVENVVRNAIKHGAGVVEIGVTRAASRVNIAVCDRGPGVHPDDLASLFQPFFRCQQVDGAANSVDGHGLGLAIARRVVDAHDGAIEVENRAGGGLAVTLSLPVAG
ncbi:ATP-binding protein [Massilia sp. S19_KUP03_FR1]|uniref:ATP-binding protein n=1 Tax=Massilia sp. S19_KUP03_FR1 TaxID=3025503 RepID=UPI002FCD9E9A